jgi:hypothetical protein
LKHIVARLRAAPKSLLLDLWNGPSQMLPEDRKAAQEMKDNMNK